MHQKFEQNKKGRDFVVGDIHGCFVEFQCNLDEIKFDPTKDRMFSVGDLVDRGDDSLSCLRLIKEPWFHAVRGNHEVMMCDAMVRRRDPDMLWFRNGGNWLTQENEEEVRDLCAITDNLPFAITLATSWGAVGICHGEPPKDWDDFADAEDVYGSTYNLKQTTVWGRTKILSAGIWDVKNISYTIHGHTPTLMPVMMGNSIYIDQGAVFAGQTLVNGRELEGGLTVLEIEKIPDMVETLKYKNVRKELKKRNKGLFD